MARSIFLALGLLLTAGCGGSGDDASPTNIADSTPTPAAVTPVPAVTWHDDIKPLVQRSCLRCHTEEGVGPGDFTRYEDAAPMAQAMAAFVEADLMPPAAADPACADYKDSERMFLDDDERALFGEWADLGAPEGQPRADAPDLSFVDRIPDEEADLILYPKKAHRPSFDETGNDYHCFVLENPRDETFYVTAMDVRPDKTQMVHHMVLYVDTDGDLGEGVDEDEGFQCFHGGSGWSFLSAWAPGAGPAIMPPGTGLKVEPHQKIVLQVHYFDSFEGAALSEDRSGYVMKTTPEVDDEMFLLPYGPSDFEIPPGDPSYTATASFTMEGDIPPLVIWGTFPHMHVLGKSYNLNIKTRAGQDQCILDGPRYDFHNQLTYFFKEPVTLGLGDTLSYSCTWDNSAENPDQFFDPPQTITYGEGTNDEMCWAFSYVTIGR